MTKDEAIKKMQAVKAYMISGNPIWSVTEMGEAFNMAIESLENYDKLAEDLQNCLEMYKKKKAEVEALKQTQTILDDGTLTITVPHGMLGKVNRVIVDEVGTKFCKMMYQDVLPSAEPQWIPCSERLPEEVGTYMTTVDYENHGIAVGQRYYHGKSLGWEDDCVIAWMPLPKPYEGRAE